MLYILIRAKSGHEGEVWVRVHEPMQSKVSSLTLLGCETRNAPSKHLLQQDCNPGLLLKNGITSAGGEAIGCKALVVEDVRE